MIDAREPKNGDFATYVESLVRLPTEQKLHAPAPGAVQTRRESRASAAAHGSGAPHTAWGRHAADPAAALEKLPEALRRVLGARTGTSPAAQGGAGPGTQGGAGPTTQGGAGPTTQGGAGLPDEMAKPFARALSRIAGIAVIAGLSILAMSFGQDPPFFADPVLGIGLIVGGALAHRASGKIAGGKSA